MVGGALAAGGTVLAATSNLAAAAAALLAVAGLATLHVLRQIRGHELAADRGAVRLLGEADSMRAALAWLEERHPRGRRRCARFLADHPARQERIAALRDP